MAFMDFLKGKKREDENLGLEDLEKELGGADLGLPELGEAPKEYPAHPIPGAPPSEREYSAEAPGAFEEPSLKPAPLERQVRELPTASQGERADSNTLYSLKKEIEVLGAKIDAIRSSLDSMNQRMINIERMALYDEEKRRKAW